MNPDVDKFSGMSPAGAPNADAESEAPFQAVEKVPSKEIVGLAPSQAVMPATQALPNDTSFSATTPAPKVQDNVAAAALVTDDEFDDEEFEKKWVNIAKSIVERTGEDPHLQSQELSKTAKEYRERLRSRGISIGKE